MVAIKSLLDALALLAALLCLAPVAPFLDLPVLLLAGAALVGGWWCDRRERHPLPPALATLLALAGVAWYLLQLTLADVATPVVHSLVVLLAVRLLTAKQARDYLQIFVLTLFILAGSSLLSLEIGFIIYLVLLVFAVTISLVLLTVYVTDPRLALSSRELWQLLRVAVLMPAASLVLMLVFFVILPRTGRPLWNFLNPAGEAVAGLAESVSPGTFARLSTVKTLAFRAEGPELPVEERYWRATVLNRLQEGRWVRGEPPEEGGVRVVGGRPVTLTLYPEPRPDRFLVVLDRPQLVRGVRSQPSPDQVYRLPAPTGQRFRYTVQAAVGADLQVSGRAARDFYLQLPEQVAPRLAAAAAQLRDAGADSSARLAALAGFFRDRRLIYAQDDLPGGPDPLDTFLFEKRRGYCEFFAAAYVTLARLAGVPARLVGGYFGGEYNALGGYYLVTDDTAHVWAEVLTDDGRWQRVDPSQWAANAGQTLGAARAGGLSPMRRLGDALNYYWVQLVVVFDLGQQLEFWRGARDGWRGLRQVDAGRWGIVLATVTLLAGVLALLGRRRPRAGREARLVAALRSRARRRLGQGVAVETLGLSELAERLDSPACREFAGIYHGAVFRDRPLTAKEYARLKELLREL